MINRRLEEFAGDLYRPLTALKFINEVLYEKIEEDWDFFQGKTRKQAEYLFSMIILNKHIIKYLFALRQKYHNKIYEEIEQ